MKHNNICVIGISDGVERKQGIENLFEKKDMTEHFPSLVRVKVMQVQEAQGSQTRRTQRGLLQHTS